MLSKSRRAGQTQVPRADASFSRNGAARWAGVGGARATQARGPLQAHAPAQVAMPSRSGARSRTNLSISSSADANGTTGTSRSTPSSPKAATTSASTAPAGVTVISTRSRRAPPPPGPAGGRPRPRRLPQVAPEPVPALAGAGRSTERRAGVPADHHRQRLLHGPGVGVRRPRSSRTRPHMTASPPPRAPHRGQVFVERVPRRSIGTPIAAISGSRYPTPIPKISRPPESTSRLASCFARTKGFRCGRITIPVASRFAR